MQRLGTLPNGKVIESFPLGSLVTVLHLELIAHAQVHISETT
jgi:hypothetical protein